ncbi:MAG TPA: MMPL family transporter [Solirubrobacteraceae bacterium]|jgi:RND superfamily putative drug exporter|nr:MMPL family transporter [Solirubrobacteraceae bacterium]
MSSTDATTERRGIVARVGIWAAAHRRAVPLLWLVLLIGTLGISSAVGTKFANNFSLPGTESQRAADLLKRDFPAQAGDSDQIVFAVRQGAVTDAAVRARVAPMLARVASLPHVTGVTSPYSAGAKTISADGKIAFATVTFNERANVLPASATERVIAVAKGAGSGQLQVALGGQAIEQVQKPALGAATAIGLLAAVIVLLITFGSFIAMGLPIITALLGLGTGIGLAGLASQVIDMPNFATELAAMIGLGVGIDYALFIVTRFRENYLRDGDLQGAIATAMDTAGRAVLFAGLTVIIALLGQFLLGVEFLYGLAVASSLAVLMTMLAALTVLPALLSRFGERIGRKRTSRRFGRKARPAGAEAPAGFWLRWSSLIERHPWPGAIAGLAIMLTLAAPALALRLGNSDAGNNPTSQTTRQAYDLLAKGFGAGVNGPLQVVAKLPRKDDGAALTQVAAGLRATGDVASVSAARLSPAGLTAVFNVYPRSSPQALATTELVSRMRKHALPPLASATGTTLLVGGVNATTIDFTHVLSSKLPLFVGIVVLLSALLLMLVFRSLVIPLQAAFMNLLSIGASLGVVVAIFQWGWLGSVFNVKGAPIQAFIPVMLFAIVFGLSMDYEVFLVSRMHEEWQRRRDPQQAVTQGLASTGRVITAAATIMICVFLSFVVGGERVLELFGLSLASAVFLDAFVVRSLLLPSVLHLIGRRTWSLPDWLERHLPHVAIDAPAPSSARKARPPELALDEAG